MPIITDAKILTEENFKRILVDGIEDVDEKPENTVKTKENKNE